MYFKAIILRAGLSECVRVKVHVLHLLLLLLTTLV